MDIHSLLNEIQKALSPMSSEFTTRKDGEQTILVFLMPLDDEGRQIRMEICCSELQMDIGVIEFYSTLIGNLTSVDTWLQTAIRWNLDSLGTYGVFTDDTTSTLFHRQMNVVDMTRPIEELTSLVYKTVLVIFYEFQRRMKEEDD